MAISVEEALMLKPGTLIQFGSPNTYEVVDVIPLPDGVHITLKRDDGYASFATHNDLPQANLRGKAEPPPAPVVEAPVAAEAVTDVVPDPASETASQADPAIADEPASVDGDVAAASASKGRKKQ